MGPNEPIAGARLIVDVPAHIERVGTVGELPKREIPPVSLSGERRIENHTRAGHARHERQAGHDVADTEHGSVEHFAPREHDKVSLCGPQPLWLPGMRRY